MVWPVVAWLWLARSARGAPPTEAELRETYFSAPTRAGADAVDAAVGFLADQAALSAANAGRGGRAAARYDDGPAVGGAPPTCKVTHDRIRAEGTFVRRGTRPYNASCFALKARYHDAPACAARRRGPPAWARSPESPFFLLGRATRAPPQAWDFTLESARRGRCRMPDPAPNAAARAFFRSARARERTLTVVMLGLSFMGQPFASLACLNEAAVAGGTVWTARTGADVGDPLPLAKIRSRGGACLGVERDAVAASYPAATHPRGYPVPTQHVQYCNLGGHALVEYAAPGLPRVRVCYKYEFNMAKNLKPDAPPACDVPWAEVDVVLHLFPNDHLRDQYLKKTNAPADLRAVVVNVNEIYEGTLEPQLRAAYEREGLEPPVRNDLRPSPKTCDARDVHYALPGFTDHAVNAWFAMIATGLGAAANATTPAQRFVGCNTAAVCKRSHPARAAGD